MRKENRATEIRIVQAAGFLFGDRKIKQKKKIILGQPKALVKLKMKELISLSYLFSSFERKCR